MSAEWFRHDADAMSDRKLQALHRLGGYEYLGIWWAVVECLCAEDGAALPRSSIDDVAYKLRLDPTKLSEFLSVCVKIELLQVEGDSFTSLSLRNRLSELAKARERKQKQREGVRSVPHLGNGTNERAQVVGQGTGQGAGQSQGQKSTPGVTGSSTGYTHLYSTQINSTQLNSTLPVTGTGTGKPPEPPPDPYAVYRKHVDKVLKVPGDPPEPWESHNLYIGSGKRPCRNAEHVWLTPQQLVELWKLYDDTAGRDQSIPLFYDALKNTQAAAQAHIDQGRPIESFKAYNHLSSWKLQDAANTRAAVARMTRNIAKELSHP